MSLQFCICFNEQISSLDLQCVACDTTHLIQERDLMRRPGTARATESALPCVRRVTIVLHRFMAQVFEIVVTYWSARKRFVSDRPMDGSATVWERVVRSEYIDLLRTRLVDRAFYRFIRRIKPRGCNHEAHADLLHCASGLPPGQAHLIAARFLVFAGGDSGVSKEGSSRYADHAPGTTVGGDLAHAFRPPPGLEAPSPFLHQLTSR